MLWLNFSDVPKTGLKVRCGDWNLNEKSETETEAFQESPVKEFIIHPSNKSYDTNDTFFPYGNFKNLVSCGNFCKTCSVRNLEKQGFLSIQKLLSIAPQISIEYYRNLKHLNLLRLDF